MKSAELLHQKIDALPESAYSPLLDYVEFLLQKYRPEDSEKEELLTQQLLMKRYEAYQRNPTELSQPLADFDTEVRQKYGWNG